MSQAIVTKYIGPTDRRGSRIKASAWAGSITVPYRSALSSAENHAAAAKVLAAKYGWHGKFIGGGVPSGEGYVFVNMAGAGVDETFVTWSEVSETTTDNT